VAIDRPLGSVRNVGACLYFPIGYFPYGEERTSTPDGTDKFGTYFRHGYGQDYADQRYYTSNSVGSGARIGAGRPRQAIDYLEQYTVTPAAIRSPLYDRRAANDEDAGCAAFDYFHL